MKNKTEMSKVIDETWYDHITSREVPTQNQIEKDILEQLYDEIANYKLPTDYPNTNYKAYKEIAKLYEHNNDLEYKTIAKIFDIENRTEIDLQNLKEFIVCVTLMGGSDILKAQVRNDKKSEKSEIKKHETRCKLMTVLLQAIDSAL